MGRHARRRRRRVPRREGRLEPLDRQPGRRDRSRRSSCRCSSAQVLEPGPEHRLPVRRRPRLSRDRRWTDLIVLRLQATRADRPPPAGPRPALLGERPVRRVGGLPPPPAAQRRRRHRRDPRREHVGDAPRAADRSSSCSARRAVPADPAPRARRARRRGRGGGSAIRRPSASIYLRGGAVFILVAVLGSLTLTATARSQPLAGAWDDLKPWLLDVSGSIQRFLPTLEDSRGIGGVQFGPQATISGSGSTDGGLALTVRARSRPTTFRYYWRAIAYDQYNNLGWEWTDGTDTQTIPRPAGDGAPRGLGRSRPRRRGPRTSRSGSRPDDLRGNYVVSPLAPLSIDRDSELLAAGDDAFFQAVQIDGHEPYSVKARVPLRGDDKGGVTENKLARRRPGLPAGDPRPVHRSCRPTRWARTPRRSSTTSSSSSRRTASPRTRTTCRWPSSTSSSHAGSSTTRTSPRCRRNAMPPASRSASRRTRRATASTTRR